MHDQLGRFGFVVALAGAACGGNTEPADAALDDAVSSIDAASTPDGSASLSWVDFAVTGCVFEDVQPVPEPDAGPGGGPDGGVEPVPDGGSGLVRRCVGYAPLELRFTAVAPAAIETYRWLFGDGEMADTDAPMHMYGTPGLYTVALTVASPRGTAQAAKIDLVEVRPAPVGSLCTRDDECELGLSCLCAESDDCPPGLASGRCTVDCDASNPCAVGTCVDLAPAQPVDPAVWQRQTCLPGCASDDECPGGLTCQEMLSATGTWVNACFAPGVLRAVGESCVGGDGLPDDDACASGNCAALGARGVCASPCVPDSCPGSSACGTFTSGQIPAMCLARCTAVDSCTSDPWLACEQPGGPGDFGFTVDEAAAEFGYCAPRTCSEALECGFEGQCTAGFCGP